MENEVWWRAEVPLRNPITSYRWLLSGGDTGYAWLNASGIHAHEVPAAHDFRILAEPGGPGWHPSSVVYEIFIDRFATTGAARPSPLWAVPREWDRLPEGRTRNTNRELFGGDLAGIEHHLDHVQSLGANVLYLTPFFPAESNHRYDQLSFDRVDPVLGGDEALASLAAAARARGLRLIGDVSLDRTGAEHEWFRRAQGDPASAERSLFIFERSESEAYVSWLGTARYPRFDWRSHELRRRMSDVLRRWPTAGLDGWRVGAANMIGRYRDADLNAEVARWARAQVGGDELLVAEYSHDFDQDVDGLGWHGVMNYAGFLRPLWWWLRSTTAESTAVDVFLRSPTPTYGGADAVSVFNAFRRAVPWDVVLQSWLPLDTHDTPRIRTVVGSRERQLVGVGLQMTSPGVPSVFAGSELGIEGAWGQDARRTMPWHGSAWDETLLDGYRRLIALRRSSGALARGSIRYVHAGEDAIVYLRETRTERLLCLAARRPHAPVVVPFPELETLYGEDARDGVLPASGPAFHVWRVPTSQRAGRSK